MRALDLLIAARPWRCRYGHLTTRTTSGVNAHRVSVVTLDDLDDVHRTSRSGWRCFVEGGSTWWTVLLEKRPAHLSEVIYYFDCSRFQGTRVSPVHSCMP